MALTPLDFPPSPAIGDTHPNPPVTGQPTYQWDGAQWLSKFALGKEYVPLDGSTPMTGLLTLSGDAVNPLHAVPKQQLDAGLLRSNYAKKNYIINGAMQVSQENGATGGSPTGYYAADQFAITAVYGGAVVFAQVASTTPAGSPNRIRITVTLADATVAAGDVLAIYQFIEGLRVADLAFGTTGAKTFTLQFGVKGPAGTYSIAIKNSTATRSYVAEYVIAAGEANTDVIKSITIPADVAGTWLKDNGMGMQVIWGLMTGATYQLAAGSWGTGNVFGSSNQFNLLGTNGNVFELFDVSLTEGTVAPPFQVPDYASELALCQRYWRWIPFNLYYSANSAGWAGGHAVYFPTMRASPTISTLSADPAVAQVSSNNSASVFSLATPNSALASGVSTGVGIYQATGYRAATNARL